MTRALSTVFSSNTDEMPISGEHLRSVQAQLSSLTSPDVRLRWYAAAVGGALLGGVLTAAAHRSTGFSVPFFAGFAAMAFIYSGFGPFLLAGWGSYVVAFVIEGVALVPNDQERVRYLAGFVLIAVSACVCDVVRRGRLRAIEREFELSQALRRSEELRLQRDAANAQQQLERDQAAARLREREEMLARITATVPGIVYQLSWYRDGRNVFTFVSERARDLFSIEPDAVVADSTVAWNRMHPDDVAAMVRGAFESMASLKPWRYEFRITDHTGAGAWRWVLGSAICQPGSTPDSVQFTGIFTDITEQRQLEEGLRQAQRIESIGRLAGGVAHDFNNLLTAITGEASLLEVDLPADGPVPDGLARIRSAAESGAAISRQLLGFARRQVMSPLVVDAETLMERSTPLLRRLLRETIRLEVMVEPRAGMVRVDPGLFDQVLLNLAANARDAMPKGGTFSVAVRRLAGDAEARRRYPGVLAGDVVEFEVRDSGVGMSAEVRERAFEPFFTTKAMGEGSGLGLSTSYGIVTQVGGAMQIGSTGGDGTTVYIALPWVDPAEAPPADRRAPLTRGTERVLVVDDDDQVRRVTAEALRRFGYDVLEARGGREAIAMAKASVPPVVLLVSDVVMPELSGVDVVNAMRREGLAPRVLYVSGYPEGTVTQHGVIPSGVQLLVKPYAVGELLRRVRAVLDHAA